MFKEILNDKKIILKSIVVLFIVNTGNAISLCIQILLSKNLSVEDFSFFYSSIALIAICASPIISQQVLIQENISNLKSNDSYKKFYINKLYKNLIFISVFYFILFFIFFEKIKLYLDYELDFEFYKLFGILIFTLFSIVPSSYLVSEKKYSIPSSIFTVLDFLPVI